MDNDTAAAKSEISDLSRYTNIAMLYDFYSPLLTKKQCETIELYYMQNLTLSEIAEISGITRQAANILLKRCEKLLNNYESKLKLVELYMAEEDKRKKILGILHEVIDLPHICDNVKDRLLDAVDYL